MKRYAAAVLVAFGVRAPLQCGHDPDPSVRTEETPGDALWNLASDFESRGEHAAAQHTLETLVARYPSSRRASAAKAILKGGAWDVADASR